MKKLKGKFELSGEKNPTMFMHVMLYFQRTVMYYFSGWMENSSHKSDFVGVSIHKESMFEICFYCIHLLQGNSQLYTPEVFFH